MEKRGQGLSTNAIILIILGVVVLAVLVIGFVIGWDKIAPWISRDNVDSIKTQCETSCSVRNTYDFCSRKRELKVEGETFKDVTCYYLAEKQIKYGITKCAGVTCNVNLAQTDTLNSAKSGCQGKNVDDVVYYLDTSDKTLKSYTCVDADILASE